MYPTEDEYYSKLDSETAAEIELHYQYLERKSVADRAWEEYVKESTYVNRD